MTWFDELRLASEHGALPVRALTRHSHPGLLGLRFWDVGASDVVRDAPLRVRAESAHGKVVEASVNRSGTWSFRKLPSVDALGVRDLFEKDAPIDALARPFGISIDDASGAFLPARFDLRAPVDGGLFDWPFGSVGTDLASPPAAGPIPLFSAPARSAPPGRLAVRADLWDAEQQRPAAWALLEIGVEGPDRAEISLGLADQRGSVVVFLPVPLVPLTASRLPASARSWRIDVRVSYAPSWTLDADSSSPPGRTSLPRLDAILAQRSEPAAFAQASNTGGDTLTSAVLTLLEPLVLRTSGVPDPTLQSRLLVVPAP